MTVTTQFLVAAYALGLGLVLAQALSLWARLNRTKDSTHNHGGRP